MERDPLVWPPMSQRGPYAKGVAKRDEILRVALEVIARNGCRKASNREIARRVGLTPPGLMHYFGSREELYEAVLRARDEHDLAAYYSPDPSFAGFVAVIAHNTEVPGLVRLYVEYSAEASIPSHPSYAFFQERYGWLRGLLTEALARAQQDGELGPELDRRRSAELLLAAADGLQYQWMLDEQVDMVAHLEGLWQLLRRSSWGGRDAAEAAVETAESNP